jgi:hypothetical protein
MDAESERLVAEDVARGVTRLFLRHDWMAVPEVPLGNARRADLMALCAKGSITIVEIKVSRADLLGDAQMARVSGLLRPLFLGGSAGL